MKISASKKQLAKIISENGGWLYGEFAVQNGNHGRISFSNNKPTRYCATGWDACGGFAAKIECCKPLPNWHQNILSRDEYFHLYPATDADGWIKWKGGECPVEKGTLVDVIWRGGTERSGVKALHLGGAGHQFWVADGMGNDIIAYRLHKPEQSKSTAVGDDETNLAAKEELEALEFEPSAPIIEQLAADYHAKLAIAQQAQEEADSHRCGAEAALEKLYQAGLAIGLDIAIADSEPEDNRKPELVITDWRDLQVGDEIEYLGGTTYSWIGKKGVVQLIDDDESNLKILFRCGEEGESGNPRDWPSTRWLSDFKFIRRP